ncbi:MAG: aminotransferase class I/II-fold pyridoxal phosphate-dependent enzyme [Marinifilaceae bacterium]|jgi:dTDP-4-amino-4,6-dideoxygalactose transaminase|nr:aminotransferase class I/II-fold pyridoxal phosphate-dependent enzyme [Marinifilaceae bacterium]
MNKRIYLSSPNMGGEEQKYVNLAFEENWVAPLGPNVNGFEEDLKEYLKVADASVLSAGTAAIHLSLVLLGINAGDSVLCSSFTFSASANPITYVGANPIFVDSEAETWNMSPDLLEEAIVEETKKNNKPKAIILVHLYGMPANMDELMAIANKYDIPVIEDAAEALGSKYKGQALGTFGKFGILSFNGNKIITTSGGGALVSNDYEAIKKSRFLATQARDNAPHYQHSHIGFNYRMSNIVAGIGRGQMKVLDKRVSQKRAIYEWYKELFSSVKGVRFLDEPNSDFYSNQWLTSIVIEESVTGFSREDLRLALEEENIEARPLWKPMHLQPIFEDCVKYVDGTSGKLFKDGLCLPSDTNMTTDDKQRIVSVLKKFI